MPVISVDLAYRSYSDIGTVVLSEGNGSIVAERVDLPGLGLPEPPAPESLAEFLTLLAHELGATCILIDGPQGWKAEDNGQLHMRLCERELSTPGKTGLPGITKPGAYLPFIAFSIALFDALDARGISRLPVWPPPTTRYAIESFPSAAWRTLGLAKLPGKTRTTPDALKAALRTLLGEFGVVGADAFSHDETQALVAGLAGLALEGSTQIRGVVAGVAPRLEGGAWREGFILNPARVVL